MDPNNQAENGEDQQQTPPEDSEGQSSSGSEQAPPQPQPSERERELERRLSRQGQELAEARRALARVESSITGLTENLSARDKRDAEERERQREAYLQTLPADQRNAERLKLLEQEVRTLRQTHAAPPPARPSSEDPDLAYVRQKAQAIVARANTRFSVELTRDDLAALPDSAWNSEDEFYDAVYGLASSKAGATGRTSEDEMTNRNGQGNEDRTRRTGSPAAPRPAPPKAKAPTEEDVRTAASSYNSVEGPRGNLKRLKEMRSRMGS